MSRNRKQGWLPDVHAALSKLADIDKHIQEMVRVEGAEEDIQAALERVREGDAVVRAEADLKRIQDHIDQDHWPSQKREKAARKQNARVAAMREAFRMSVVFSRPRAFDEDLDRPGWAPYTGGGL